MDSGTNSHYGGFRKKILLWLNLGIGFRFESVSRSMLGFRFKGILSSNFGSMSGNVSYGHLPIVNATSFCWGVGKGWIRSLMNEAHLRGGRDKRCGRPIVPLGPCLM